MSVVTIDIEQDEDGWFVATVREMPGCHTQARTEAEVRERIREAIELWRETHEDDSPRE